MSYAGFWNRATAASIQHRRNHHFAHEWFYRFRV